MKKMPLEIFSKKSRFKWKATNDYFIMGQMFDHAIARITYWVIALIRIYNDKL